MPGEPCAKYAEVTRDIGILCERCDEHRRDIATLGARHDDCARETRKRLLDMDRKITAGGVVLGIIQALLLAGVGALIRTMIAP